MYSLRKWMFKPKKPDESLLAEFFYTDEELNAVAAELDSFDGRKDPERCTSLVNKLRRCQDKVLAVIEKILQYVIPDKRASRDFRVKFPDDVLQDNLSGQLWFGAECLAAGSSIMNREVESASMRPLAKALTKQLDVLRSLLRDQCLRNQFTYSDKISEALVLFDKLFAEFELSYVSAMVPVKTMKEYDKLQEVMVLFCETVQRALKLGLLTQEMIDDYDPALMFTIPRLAIICGLLVYPEGPINPDMDPMNMSEMFRPFQMLLYKIRELLWTLSPTELWLLEKALSSSEDSLSLSDAAFEEQLNKLNWLQLQSKHEPLDTLAAAYSATVPSSISSQGGEADQEVTEEVNECIQDISKMETCPPEVISDSDQEDICQENCDRETTEVELISNEDTSIKIDHDTDKADDNDGSKSFPHKDDLESLCCSNRDPEYENCDTGNLLSCYSEDRYPEGDCSGCLGIDPELKEDIQPESSNHADQNKDSRSSTEQALNDRTSVSHQDSGDSGMISMSDHVSASSTKVTMDSICHTPRLYWSKSWPAHSDSSRNPSRSHRHSICCDCSRYMYNLEVLQSHCTTEAGAPAIRSQEFVFHLPCDTSLTGSPAEGVVEMDLMGTEDQQDPLHTEAASADSQDSSIQVEDTPKCIGETASEEVPGGARIQLCQRNDSHIIYTLNGQQRPCSDASHMVNSDTANSSQIAFITGALNDIFFTDPEFQGVTPPRTPSTSSSSSASCDKCQQSSGQRRQSWEPNLDCTRCKQHTRSSNNNNRSGLLPGAEKCQHHPHSNPSICSTDWDGESCTNSDTSSYTSDVNDDEEIALAIQAAEIAARQEARARFRNSSELIHKLFVCISGVADQLQTNYASDLRHILKAVFECNSTLAEEDTHSIDKKCSQQSAISRTDQELPDADTDSGSSQSNVDSESNTNVPVAEQGHNTDRNQEPEPSVTVANTAECPPHWVPDDESPYCMSCGVPFTFVRRRHHCRNCGKIFCSRCSSNSVPLPHYGHDKPVRVCNHCFIYQVTPFTVAD